MEVLSNLYEKLESRKVKPQEGSYTNYLYEKGIEKICKKVGEESSEVIIGAIKGDKDETINEISDLLYHLMVLMIEMGIGIEDIEDCLEARSKKEGNKKLERKLIEDI